MSAEVVATLIKNGENAIKIFDKWKKYYDLGFTTLIPNVLDTHEKHLNPQYKEQRWKNRRFMRNSGNGWIRHG